MKKTGNLLQNTDVHNESEELYKILAKSSPVGIYIVQDDRFCFVNPQFQKYTGYTEEALLKMNPQDIIYPEDREKVRQHAIDMLKKHTLTPCEFRTIRRDGEIHWGLVTTTSITYKGRRSSLGNYLDITESKRMEEALANETVRRRILIEQSSDGIVILDETGKVQEANLRFAKMLGYTNEEILKLHTWDWEYRSTREQLTEIMDTGNREGRHFETQHRRKDGSIYDVEISSNTATFANQKLIFCVCRDITERKRMEQALRESEEKFLKAFRAIPQAISLSRITDGIFVDVNDNYCSRNGLNRDEVIGHTAIELGLWDQFDKHDLVLEALQKQGSVENMELPVIIPSGELHTVLISAVKLDIGGEFYALTIGNDITDRKRAEEAQKQSEEKFSKAFLASPAMISITTLKDGKIIEANDNFNLVTGYNREEVIGRSTHDLGLWARAEDRTRMLQMLKEKGAIHGEEFAFHVKSGEIRTWLFSAEKININNEPCLIVMALDITDRKNAEKALQESQLFNNSLLDNSPSQILVVNPDTSVKYANKKWEEVNGWSLKDILGLKAPYPWWPKDEHPEETLKTYRASIISNGETELIARKKNGENYWLTMHWVSVKQNAEPLFCIITSFDISDRKVAEAKIREKNRLLNNILESITHPFYVIDVNDYSIVMANSATNAGDLLKKPTCHATTHRCNQPCNDTNNICPLEEMKITKKPVVVEHLHYDKDNNIRNVEVHGYPVIDRKGNFIQMIEYSLDITQRKKIEAQLDHQMEELQAANVKLLELDKMKDSFLSTVSHELRTPLTSIKSFTEILLAYDEDKETQKEFLTIINQESDRLTKLINDFLDLSKIEAGRMQWDDKEQSLVPVIQNAINITQALAKDKQLAVEFAPPADIPPVTCDRDRIVQVVTNFLSNSIKFTPAAGKITVGLRVDKAGVADNPSGMVVVSVTDTGIGIAKENHALVFEKFKQVGDTLTDKPKGTGLGLPICKEIVEHYGGKVWVESELGKGSTFLFSLPVVKQAESSVPLPEFHEAPVQEVKTGKLVLVVDDEENIRLFLSHELSKKGYNVITAANGKEALDMAREHHPDLITLDIQMPDINGFDVTVLLKNDESTRNIPVLIISVIDNKGKAYKLGANDYLTKPFDNEELVAKINKLMIGNKKTVLIADDDVSLVKSVKYHLEHKGYSTLVAYDGKQALEIAEQSHPDLIVLDIVMPNMDGYQVLKSLKSNPKLANIPVVLVTGIEIDGGRVKAFSIGATDYIPKSGDFNRLYKAIDDILVDKPE